MIEETRKLLSNIAYSKQPSNCYILLRGSDNKVWLIPEEQMKVGLLIFQPGSLKGRLVKLLLPYVGKIKLCQKLLHIKRCQIRVNDEIQSVCESAVEVKKLWYTIYVGDATFIGNRKIILQIATANKVLGYAKFALDETNGQKFQRETHILSRLKSLGVKNIPDVLWCGKTKNLYGFIQTSEKIGNEPVAFSLDQRHWEFLDKLNKHTRRRIEFRNSPYEKMLFDFEVLLKNGTWEKNTENVLNIITFIRSKFEKEGYEGSFFHADFTPWNICLKQDYIFVFDFEYSCFDFPAWMDAFHFVTQVGILYKDLSAEKIFAEFIKNKIEYCKRMNNPELQYVCYLLFILYFYDNRWAGGLPEDEKNCSVWLKLLYKFSSLCLKED